MNNKEKFGSILLTVAGLYFLIDGVAGTCDHAVTLDYIKVGFGVIAIIYNQVAAIRKIKAA